MWGEVMWSGLSRLGGEECGTERRGEVVVGLEEEGDGLSRLVDEESETERRGDEVAEGGRDVEGLSRPVDDDCETERWNGGIKELGGVEERRRGEAWSEVREFAGELGRVV